MAVDLKGMAQTEMEAYDALPECLRNVFDNAPRKVSVLQVMSLPNVKKMMKTHTPEDVATVLKAHFDAQAEQEAVVTT